MAKGKSYLSERKFYSSVKDRKKKMVRVKAHNIGAKNKTVVISFLVDFTHLWTNFNHVCEHNFNDLSVL